MAPALKQDGGETAATTDISRRLEFMQLGERECQSIRTLGDFLRRELPNALDRFYEQLRKSPEVNRFFGSEDHIGRAKSAQLGHWSNISAGDFSSDYVAKVRAIGTVHARIGLEPQWYIGGYAIILEHLIQQAAREFQARKRVFGRRPDITEFSQALASLVKAVLLDMDLAISVYIDQAEIAKRQAQSEAIRSERGEVCGMFGKALEKIAAKDLTYRISADVPETYRSLRDDFNQAADALSDTIRHIGSGATQIQASSDELKSASDDLARRTEQQAASIEETAAAIEEITTTVGDTARRAEAAGQIVLKAKAGAEKSGVVVQQAITAMGAIEQSSREIGSIIGVIDEIAFQTNLLALNAGVEAARAGDAGKGFAVVAQEVRELAQRSAKAAREIKELITNSADQVKRGVNLVGETGTSLTAIVADVSDIDVNIAAIVQASREQATALQAISAAVGRLDQDTQKNAGIAEESTAATHALAQELTLITKSIGTFVVPEETWQEQRKRA